MSTALQQHLSEEIGYLWLFTRCRDLLSTEVLVFKAVFGEVESWKLSPNSVSLEYGNSLGSQEIDQCQIHTSRLIDQRHKVSLLLGLQSQRREHLAHRKFVRLDEHNIHGIRCHPAPCRSSKTTFCRSPL